MANIQTIHHEQQEQRQMLEIIMHNQIVILSSIEGRPDAHAAGVLVRVTKQWLQENKKTDLPSI